MKKTALIIGITGQDGSYLAELLLSKHYRVIGLCRNPVIFNNEIEIVIADITDKKAIVTAIEYYQPDEVYNLAAQSSPNQSWRFPFETMECNGIAAHYLFETIRLTHPRCRIFQASSAEMFGDTQESSQNESTPFKPVSPYGVAKLYAHHMARLYRQSYDLFISCGILYNHESPRRGMHFITQKIAYAAACLALGITHSPLCNEHGDPIVNGGLVYLGNIDAKRDWGFAGDYVQMMWLMLQQDKPDDFVIGTGQLHSIRELCQMAFSYVNLNWENYVRNDPRLVRPLDTKTLVADPKKAQQQLGWQARNTLHDVMAMMIESHLEKLRTASPHKIIDRI